MDPTVRDFIFWSLILAVVYAGTKISTALWGSARNGAILPSEPESDSEDVAEAATAAMSPADVKAFQERERAKRELLAIEQMAHNLIVHQGVGIEEAFRTSVSFYKEVRTRRLAHHTVFECGNPNCNGDHSP